MLGMWVVSVNLLMPEASGALKKVADGGSCVPRLPCATWHACSFFVCVCAMSLYIEASNTELSVTSNSAEQQNAAAWHAG